MMMNPVSHKTRAETPSESSSITSDNTASTSRRKALLAVSFVSIGLLAGCAVYFARGSTAIGTTEFVASCPESKVTLHTANVKFADTETGLFFCNGASDGCSRLDTPDHDDFERGRTKEYTITTTGGSSDFFCICGSRDAWTGQVKAVDLCGKQYTSNTPPMRISMNENVGSAYQCGKFEVGPDPDLKQWVPSTWSACKMNVFVISLKYLGSKTFDEKTVRFRTNGDSALLNRWNSRDFTRGSSDVFYVVLNRPLGETFDISVDSSDSFQFQITRIEAPISASERIILTPKDTQEYRINRPVFWSGLRYAYYYGGYVRFNVDLDAQTFSRNNLVSPRRFASAPRRD